MVFGLIRRWRRRKMLAQPAPRHWRAWIDASPLFAQLSPLEQSELERIVQVLVHEKRWEGCGGLQLTEEMKVTIAAQAALLLLHIDHDYYGRTHSILVYPSTFVNPAPRHAGGGIMTDGTATLGEAWYDGPIVLAWDATRHGVVNHGDGHNLVLHEFAHRLDFNDFMADGTPVLESKPQFQRWVAVMTEHHRQLVDAVERGRPTLLQAYGATNSAEFFAVATECFFEKGRQMQREHPELYDVLRDYYGQDPAERGPITSPTL